MVVEVKTSPRVRMSGQSPGRPGRVLKMSGRPDNCRTRPREVLGRPDNFRKRPGQVRTSGLEDSFFLPHSKEKYFFHFLVSKSIV